MTPRPLATMERLWFGLIVAAQLAMIFAMPAFNGPDERGHFIRMWALVEGNFSCNWVPASVREVDAMRQVQPHEDRSRYFQRGMNLPMHRNWVNGWDYECSYFPIGLTMPATVTWMVMKTTRHGSVFLASYAARMSLAFLLDAALLFLLRAIPWGRTAALAFFSIPQVIQQSFCIGHDSFLLVLTMLILVAATRPPSWASFGCIVAAASGMALVKPVYAPFALLAVPVAMRLHQAQPFRWRTWLEASAILVPFLAYPCLRLSWADARENWTPSFAHSSLQAHYLVHHPLHVFRVFAGYLHYFVDDHTLVDFYPRLINGKWTTILGVFGNAELEMAFCGYLCVLAALVLAIAADACRPSACATDRRIETEPHWPRVIAAVGVLAPIPLTVLALYLVFSRVGADAPYGVQGRYHLPSILLISMFAVQRLRRTLPPSDWHRAGALLAFVAAAAANVFAITAIVDHYWS